MGRKIMNEGKVGLTSVLRRGSLNLVAFGYLTAASNCGVDWNAAIQAFIKHFNLDESDIDPETVRREMNRMTVDYIKEGL